MTPKSNQHKFTLKTNYHDRTDLLSKAEERLGDEYELGIIVAKNNRDWIGSWDCAEFCSWVVYQTSRQLYGCFNNEGSPSHRVDGDAYTGYWARDSYHIGGRIEVETAIGTPGAAILRKPGDSGTGGHIVFSDGLGGTIEAHSSARGVIRHVVVDRRWDYGVLVPWIEYERGKLPVPPDTYVIYRLVSPRMRGGEIEVIQRALIDHGVNPGKVDGIFGPLTAAAVHAFQISSGLVPDAEVGPDTAGALGISGSLWP